MNNVDNRIHDVGMLASPMNLDRLIPELSQLLGYRQRVAEEVFESKNKDTLLEHIDYLNDQIKKLLLIHDKNE